MLSKREGYRSRAAFKLKQIISEYNVIRTGDVILDIGCAPGGWLQVASEAAGGSGMVIGVDLKAVEDLGLENVKTMVLDVFDRGFAEKVMEASGGMFDVLLSDLSPNMSGIYELDHARQIEMMKRVIELSKLLLKRNGSMVVKVFEGKYSPLVEREILKMFRIVRKVKPKASRKRSSEYYLVAKFFKGSG
ncbi:MAG: SAM-dependent methyltransferase [Thermoproteota archaeon]